MHQRRRPTVSYEPGSSAIAQAGTPTNPIAAFARSNRALEGPRVRRLVNDADPRVLNPRTDNPPRGSSASTARNGTVMRPCSIGRGDRSPISVSARNVQRIARCPWPALREVCPRATLLPLPRGADQTAVSIPVAVAAAMKRRWKGLRTVIPDTVTQKAPHHGPTLPAPFRRCHPSRRLQIRWLWVAGAHRLECCGQFVEPFIPPQL